MRFRRLLARSWAGTPSAAHLLLGVPTLLVLLFGRYRHEPWGDETQAYLIAHHQSGFGFLHMLALEGVAPLFHLFLKVVDHLVPAAWVLPIAGAVGYGLLLLGTFRLLEALSARRGLSLLVTLLLGATDTYAYELGIVARPYGAGLGLAFLAAASLVSRRKKPRNLHAGAWAALCMLTSVHAGCVVGGLLVTETLWTYRTRTLRNVLAGLALPLFAIAVDLYFIRPNPSRTTYLTQFNLPSPSEAFFMAAKAIEDGLGASGWWPSPHRGEWKVHLWGPTVLAIGVATGGALASASEANRLRIRFGALAWTLGSGALLVILLCFHYGAYRHHLLLVLPAIVYVVALLLTRSGIGEGSRKVALCLLLPLMAHEFRQSAFDFGSDYRAAFTEASQLRERLPQGARLVVQGDDMIAIGALVGRDDVTLRSAENNAGAVVRHAIVDTNRFKKAPLSTLLDEECAAAPNRTYLVVDRSKASQVDTHCLEPEPLQKVPSLGLQAIDVSHVKCTCLHETAHVSDRGRLRLP